MSKLGIADGGRALPVVAISRLCMSSRRSTSCEDQYTSTRSAGIHSRGIARRHRNHRGPDCRASSRIEQGAAGCADCDMFEQPARNRPRVLHVRHRESRFASVCLQPLVEPSSKRPDGCAADSLVRGSVAVHGEENRLRRIGESAEQLRDRRSRLPRVEAR